MKSAAAPVSVFCRASGFVQKSACLFRARSAPLSGAGRMLFESAFRERLKAGGRVEVKEGHLIRIGETSYLGFEMNGGSDYDKT